MKEEGFSPARDILSAVAWVLDAIRDIIRYFKWHRPMQQADQRKRLEKELLFEIVGARYGGMAMSGAYLSFRKEYYDKLSAAEEQREVRGALLRMLRSDRYSVSEKEMIASVCTDLKMEEAFQDVVLVREAAARNMSMGQLFRFKRQQAIALREHNLEYGGSALSRG